MSLLEELQSIAKQLDIRAFTAEFPEKAPNEYVVFTPLNDGFEVHADDVPNSEIQEVRISIFTKGNYTALKNKLTKTLISADVTITDRRYIEYERETGYHHYAIDVAKNYELEGF